MGFLDRDRTKEGEETAMQDESDRKLSDVAPPLRAAAALCLEPTELLVFLRRRQELDQRNNRIVFTGFDICHPDGRPVSVSMHRFCQQGTRLLWGRARQVDRALVRITLFPVAELEAALTRPGRGVRCRRFYALRKADEIRLHFLDGTPTEMVFHDRSDDPAVLYWLRADHIRSGIPFWFDLACTPDGNGMGPSAS
jgi:hypothetical protein